MLGFQVWFWLLRRDDLFEPVGSKQRIGIYQFFSHVSEVLGTPGIGKVIGSITLFMSVLYNIVVCFLGENFFAKDAAVSFPVYYGGSAAESLLNARTDWRQTELKRTYRIFNATYLLIEGLVLVCYDVLTASAPTFSNNLISTLVRRDWCNNRPVDGKEQRIEVGVKDWIRLHVLSSVGLLERPTTEVNFIGVTYSLNESVTTRRLAGMNTFLKYLRKREGQHRSMCAVMLASSVTTFVALATSTDVRYYTDGSESPFHLRAGFLLAVFSLSQNMFFERRVSEYTAVIDDIISDPLGEGKSAWIREKYEFKNYEETGAQYGADEPNPSLFDHTDWPY